MTDEQKLAQLEALLTQHHEAEAMASTWVLREKELRKQICDLMFPAPVPGTNKVRISHGMALIMDYRINYRVDRAALDMARKEPDYAPLLDTVINYRPEVRDSAFKKLSNDDKKRLAAIITETPGTPGLELKPQNKVRW